VVGVHVSVAQSVDELASFEAWKNKSTQKSFRLTKCCYL
jgi:hypothetical protein